MIVGVVCGALLLVAGLAGYRRARMLLIDRWRVLRPRDWNEAMRPARRAFPFNFFRRSEIVRHRMDVWRWSTPAWALEDPAARKGFRLLQRSSLAMIIGAVVIALAVMTA